MSPNISIEYVHVIYKEPIVNIQRRSCALVEKFNFQLNVVAPLTKKYFEVFPVIFVKWQNVARGANSHQIVQLKSTTNFSFYELLRIEHSVEEQQNCTSNISPVYY